MSTLVHNTIFKKYRLIKGMSLFATVIIVSGILFQAKSLAFSPNYNPSNLIDNPTLLDNGTMSPTVIQSFLSNIGSGLASYSDVEACDSTIAPYYSHCGQTISAAQIIYDASQAYGINPQAILADLEKEQSLVTDPTPSASQINCAMGYNSCASYVGFFTQVDNGTWALRYNYEGAAGDTTWARWSPGANYACGHATSLYSAALIPGNTVTFADPGGTAETVTLTNAATASLYCYTPYVGPYSQTGYSGSYNFVYFFQLWFGSTQASSPYAWAYEGQATYTSSSETASFTGGVPVVAPGGSLYVTFEARNVGYQSWNQSSLHVATSDPDSRVSSFYDTSWLNSQRPAGLAVSSVPPGGEATFGFTLHAPSQPGQYSEYYSLVADGIQWLNDPGLYFVINVVAPRTASSNSQQTELASGQSLRTGQYLLSQSGLSSLDLQNDGNLVLYNEYAAAWNTSTYGTRADDLAMQTDGNLVLYNSSGQALWNSQTEGNPGADAVLQTDGNLVIYNTSGQAVWNSGTNSTPSYLLRTDELLSAGQEMHIGQFLETDDGNYVLQFQGDGNLVLLYQGHPIWATMTNGQSASYVAMQTDGNLVIYNTSGQAVWNSRTSGHGPSFLITQPDGNLVVYNSSIQPTWDSGTER